MKSSVGNFDALLSPLETDILKQLWPTRKLRVRQLYDRLCKTRKVALSSVAVICDRLHSRGILGRTIENGRGGVRYVYFPKLDRKNFEKSVVASAVDNLIGKFGSTAVAYFEERFRRK